MAATVADIMTTNVECTAGDFVTAKNEYVEVEHFPVSNSRKGKHE
jgi:hypothetical protein